MTTPQTSPSEPSLSSPLERLVRFLIPNTDQQASPVDESDVRLGETLDLLAPRRRRIVLDELAAATQPPLAASTLAERVACVEYDCTPEALETKQRKRVYIALTQSHLPTLHEADVIAYAADAKRVDRGPRFDSVWGAYVTLLEYLT